MIEFFINGNPVKAQKGETILHVARREGYYIPTMCYLEKTAPIASCRLCVVDIKGVDGQILSCQTPPTAGIEVFTDSPNLRANRENIMRLYDVNHPLECGVCDKSGECELQNKSLEFGIASQSFSVREPSRSIQKWGLIQYDPSLCIVCERCTHVCNEVIGDDAIEILFGGYGSTVIPKNSDTLDCTFCGECIAVCPVGALISSEFKYRANAWELESIPSTCVHCSAGCALEYEVKTSNAGKSIYRVKNNFEYTTLCGAGRFGFDFATKNVHSQSALFDQAVEALQKSDAVRFGSMITNEEALLLQRLHEKTGKKLLNADAYAFKQFLANYAVTAPTALYEGTLAEVAQSDQIILVGSRIATDNPQVRYAMTMASKRNKAKISYMHSIEDALMQSIVTQFVKYEVGTEAGVMALLAKTFIDTSSDKALKAHIDSLDEGYLSAESNVGDDELAYIAKVKQRAKKTTLILGEDCYTHANANLIAQWAGLIARTTNIRVLMVPKEVNTLGVALICDVVDEQSAKAQSVFGYNAHGDYHIGVSAQDALAMPALNQQEGTITSIDKKVLTLNVALPHEGYELLDVLRSVSDERFAHTIELTPLLPQSSGYVAVAFDDLFNVIDAQGRDTRGYDLRNAPATQHALPALVEQLPEYNGTIIYHANPVLQFNALTAGIAALSTEAVLVGSAQFATAAKIGDGEKIVIETSQGRYERRFVLDESLKGTVALHPTFDLSSDALPQGYRFAKAKISKR
ncbi:MAG: ferredoxin [Sulfuricurvum sp. PC08-66]|nr:MAG: ferredoxin [Sulfuricurvum sp. PC08-66]